MANPGQSRQSLGRVPVDRGASARRGQVRAGRPDVVRPDRARTGDARSRRAAQGRRGLSDVPRPLWTSARGIGGDALALAAGLERPGGRPDEGMCRRAVLERWGLRRGRSGGSRSGRGPSRLEFPRGPGPTSTRIDDLEVDPRAHRIEGYRPDLAFLQRLTREAPGGAIKLGPASDFAEHFGDDRIGDRAGQPGTRVQGGDRLVWRGGDVSSAGDEFARGRDLDRSRRSWDVSSVGFGR